MPSLWWGKLRTLALIGARLGLVLFVGGSILTLRPAPVQAATVNIPIGEFSIYGFWFCDASHVGNVCTTTIQVGDSVTWQDTAGTSAHTSTECDGVCGTIPSSPLWDLAIAPYGTTAPLQFNQAGTFNYQCNVHPDQMKGQIVVLAPTQTATPMPTPPPAVGGISLDPGAGSLPLQSGSSSGPDADLLAEVIAGTAATAVALGAAAWYARRRWLGRGA